MSLLRAFFDNKKLFKISKWVIIILMVISMSSYILIGKVVGTHGIKGEIKISSNHELKEQIFIPNFKLYFGQEKWEEKIVTYRHHKIYDMVTLAGYSNINEVLKYNKQNVYVKREDLKIKDYLLEDLVGLTIIESNQSKGRVINVIHNGPNILLEVEGENHFYIPKVSDYIEKIDIPAGKIYVKNIRGLML